MQITHKSRDTWVP